VILHRTSTTITTSLHNCTRAFAHAFGCFFDLTGDTASPALDVADDIDGVGAGVSSLANRNLLSSPGAYAVCERVCAHHINDRCVDVARVP
jgi:hypothetical protein